MIDIKLLQKDFDTVAKALIRKGVDEDILNKIKILSLETKEKRQQMESLQAEQNKLSSLFGAYKKEGKDISSLQKDIANIKKTRTEYENEVKQLESNIESVLLGVPNMPDDIVPNGIDETQNVLIEKIGTIKEFNFEPKEHWDIGEKNGWLDFTRGVKLAKSRFSALSGDAARLERALINYMLDFNSKRGFKEWYVPFMANSNSLQGTGQLPKFEDDLFKIEDEDLYLIPTAEVSLTNLYNDEIIDEKQLPLLLTSYTPCFRKEAGSAGRDTRGLIRQHQFDKVEMVAITKQDQSEEVFEKMVSCASDLLSSLGLLIKK
jgi:seryl-tRNA synthetase